MKAFWTVFGVAVLLSIATFSRGDDVGDGPFLRSTARFTVRAQITDYTGLGGPRYIATITIQRGNFYRDSRNVVANANQTVGVWTTVPGRVYSVTCQYRGRTITRNVAARQDVAYVGFTYTAGGGLQAFIR